MQFKLREIHTAAVGLTQARFAGNRSEVLAVSNPQAPMVFSTSFMASLTGDYLFEVGRGDLNPLEHARLLAQYAADNGISLSVIADDYIDLLRSLGLSMDGFRTITAGIVGVNERPITSSGAPAVTPTYVLSLVKKVITTNHEVLLHLVTDYVCHMFRPLGWILSDAGYVYRIRRTNVFPRYVDLVNSVHAIELMRVLEQMANANLDLIHETARSKKAILPAMVAQHLASAVLTATELAAGSYDATAIVDSVLGVLGRVWDPTTPRDLMPKERVSANTHFANLRTNLSLFLAYQDRITNHHEPLQVHYSDEEMSSIVLGHFVDAITKLSPYRSSHLSDCVQHMTKVSSRDHEGRPGTIFVTEDWNFSHQVTAFTPIRNASNTVARFLHEQIHISAALTTAMKPIQSVLSIQGLVDSRIGTLALAATSKQVPRDGSTFVLGLPSLLEREVELGLPFGTMMNAIINGEGEYMKETSVTDPETGKVDVTKELAVLSADVVSQLRHDYYAMMVHLAVSRNSSVSVSSASTEGREARSIYLVWRERTSFLTPMGNAAVLHREVVTSEPLEALTYTEDFRAMKALEHKEVPLADFQKELHIWDFRRASVGLDFLAPYQTTIRNRVYTVTVDEHEALGLGVRRRNVRFLRPTMAAAVARLWLDWIGEEEKIIAREIARNAKDDLIRTAYEGRRIQNAIKMANLLMKVGSTGAGERANTFIRNRLADEMYGRGYADDYAEIHVGIERHKLAIWSGLLSLQLMGLVSAEEASGLVSQIAANNTLSMIVGMIDLEIAD